MRTDGYFAAGGRLEFVLTLGVAVIARSLYFAPCPAGGLIPSTSNGKAARGPNLWHGGNLEAIFWCKRFNGDKVGGKYCGHSCTENHANRIGSYYGDDRRAVYNYHHNGPTDTTTAEYHH